MGRFGKCLIAACLVLPVAACGGGGSTGTSGPALISVPNVVGLTQAAATTAITSAGLTVGTVTTQSSSTVASGNVISESPMAGTRVASGSAVNLVVSSGPALISVPNVVGLTQAAATTAIASAGLTVGTVTTQSSSTVSSGNVISESPMAGTSVASGSAVNLVVSSGSVSYPVYVAVTGLDFLLETGQQVTVLDNGADSLTFQYDGTKQFATQLALNSTFNVTVSVPPTLETCTLSGGSGIVTGPVSVSVSCVLAPSSTVYPAFAAPYPLVVSGTTPPVVISSPKIIPVFFSDVPDQAATVAYLEALVTSPEWSAVSQYGVGAATVGTPVYLTSAAPAATNPTDIQTYVAANSASWATLDGSEIFVLYYPASTTVTDSSAAYHDRATVAGKQVPYAVITDYGQSLNPDLPGNYYEQYHELIEASTDPFPGEGYGQLNHDSTAWALTGGTELADMCEDFAVYYDASLGETMAGIWSDSAVSAGQAPCPTPGSSGLGPGFGAYPALPSTYVASQNPGDTDASVSIAPGQSVTIPVNVFSYGPLAAPIILSVSQTNANSANTNALAFSFDRNVGLNGSVVHLTITAPQTPLSSTTNYASFRIESELASGNNGNTLSAFPGVVTNP